MKLLKSTSMIFSVMAAFALLLISPDAAAESWADVFESGAETVVAFKKLVVVAAYAVGAFLFFMGLWLVYKDGKEENRGHMKNGMISLVIGALLLIFPTAVGWTVGTFGAEESSVDEKNFEEF